MCLRSQVIGDDSGSVGGGRRDRGFSNENGGFGRGRGIDDASDGLETTAEVAGFQQKSPRDIRRQRRRR